MNLDSSIKECKGIGEKTEKCFHNLGVYTVGDILLHYPRKYEAYPEPVTIQQIWNDPEGVMQHQEQMLALDLRVMTVPVLKYTKRMPIVILKQAISDCVLDCVWYRSAYIKNILKPGERFVLYGKVSIQKHGIRLEQPVVYTLEQYGKIAGKLLPIYALTSGLTNKTMQKTMQQVLEQIPLEVEYLPEELRKRQHLAEYNFAVKQLHFPDDYDQAKQAMERMIFDEFLFFIMGMKMSKMNTQIVENEYAIKVTGRSETLLQQLPYQLTNAQLRTLQEVLADMQSPYMMQRLIQGDVGSGKTIIAFLAMLEVATNGYQSALMVPTEVLARQHFQNFQELAQEYALEDLEIILLTGSMTAKEKRSAYERIATTPNAMVIGTHALIQEKVVYMDLALVITDEQHRFGVKQRETLSEKGKKPHILVMSATPIPRTLAIILYGDLDISLIDELPAKRLPIKNCVVDETFRKKTYAFIEQEIAQKHQCYVICPLVEKSENLEAENVVDYTEKLKAYFPDSVRIECLHGKMKPKEKNHLMEQFAANEIQILVSTTVIEVGVNVPNATVMLIEDAQRFGLAQLHQLRGRVGRGSAQSYCILMNSSKEKSAKNRLEILNQSNDGFFIAEEDLKLRGPGDFFGIRQSGDFSFKIADIYRDAAWLKAAAMEADQLLRVDSELALPEHQALKVRIYDYYSHFLENVNL